MLFHNFGFDVVIIPEPSVGLGLSLAGAAMFALMAARRRREER